MLLDFAVACFLIGAGGSFVLIGVAVYHTLTKD